MRNSRYGKQKEKSTHRRIVNDGASQDAGPGCRPGRGDQLLVLVPAFVGSIARDRSDGRLGKQLPGNSPDPDRAEHQRLESCEPCGRPGLFGTSRGSRRRTSSRRASIPADATRYPPRGLVQGTLAGDSNLQAGSDPTGQPVCSGRGPPSPLDHERFAKCGPECKSVRRIVGKSLWGCAGDERKPTIQRLGSSKSVSISKCYARCRFEGSRLDRGLLRLSPRRSHRGDRAPTAGRFGLA